MSTADAPGTASTDANSDTSGTPAPIGRFGSFGGRYVPEALVAALEELDEARLKAEVDKHYWTFTRCARVNPAAMVAAHQPLSFAERVLRRIWRRRHRLNHRQERAA